MTDVLDRFGRPIQAGDIVHLLGKTDILWRVIHVRPILDPKAPAGLVEVAMQAGFITGVPGGQLVTDLIKLRDASEFPQPGQEAGNGANGQGQGHTDAGADQEEGSGADGGGEDPAGGDADGQDGAPPKPRRFDPPKQ